MICVNRSVLEGLEQEPKSQLCSTTGSGAAVLCLKSLIISQDSTVLAGVRNRWKRFTLKNLCAEESEIGRIHWKKMTKLFCSAVRLLNYLPDEYSSLIIFFSYMIFLSSHPTKAFDILAGVLGVLEFQLYKSSYSPYTRCSYTAVFFFAVVFLVLRPKNLIFKMDFFLLLLFSTYSGLNFASR